MSQQGAAQHKKQSTKNSIASWHFTGEHIKASRSPRSKPPRVLRICITGFIFDFSTFFSLAHVLYLALRLYVRYFFSQTRVWEFAANYVSTVLSAVPVFKMTKWVSVFKRLFMYFSLLTTGSWNENEISLKLILEQTKISYDEMWRYFVFVRWQNVFESWKIFIYRFVIEIVVKNNYARNISRVHDNLRWLELMSWKSRISNIFCVLQCD